jgi:hypothetical protein
VKKLPLLRHISGARVFGMELPGLNSSSDLLGLIRLLGAP